MSHPSVRTHFELKLRTSGFDGSRAAGARVAAADADHFMSGKHAHWAASQRLMEERIAAENRRMAKRIAQTQPYVGARSMMDASTHLHFNGGGAAAAASPHSSSGASSRAASASRSRAPPRSAFSASYHPPRSGSAAEDSWEPPVGGEAGVATMMRRPSPPLAMSSPSRPVSAYGSASHPYSAAEWGAAHSQNSSGAPSRAASAAPHRPNVHAQPRPASAAMHAGWSAAAAAAEAAAQAVSPYTQAPRSRKSSRRSSSIVSPSRRRSSSRPSHRSHSSVNGVRAHPRVSPSHVAAWLAGDEADDGVEDADFDLDQLRRSFEAELDPHAHATQQQQQQQQPMPMRPSRPPSGSMRPKPPPPSASAGSSRIPSAARSRPQQPQQHVQFPSHPPHPHLLQQHSLPPQHGDGSFAPVAPSSPSGPRVPALHPAQIAAHHHPLHPLSPRQQPRSQHQRQPSPPASAPPSQRHFDVDPATFFQQQHQVLMEAALRQQQEQQFEQQFDPVPPYASPPPQQMQLNGRSWTPSFDTPASPRSTAARASGRRHSSQGNQPTSPRFSNEQQQQHQRSAHEEEKENTHDPASSSSSEPPVVDDGSGVYTLAPSGSRSSGSASYQPVLAMETFASGAQRYSARNAEFVLHPSRESRIAAEMAALQQERLGWTEAQGHLGHFEGQPVFHAGLQTIPALAMQAQLQSQQAQAQQDGSNDGAAPSTTPQPSSLSAHIKYASSSDSSSSPQPSQSQEEKYSSASAQPAASHHHDRPQSPLSYDRSRRQVLVSERGSAAPAASAAPSSRSSWRRHGGDTSHALAPAASLFSAGPHPLSVALHAELRHHPLTLRRDFFSAAESDAAEAARARAQDEADDGDDAHLAPWMRARARDAPQAIPMMPHSAAHFSQSVSRYTRDN